MKKEIKTEVITVPAINIDGIGLVYTVESVMKILRVSLPTLKKYEKGGAIKIVKLGKSYITAQSLARYFGIDLAPHGSQGERQETEKEKIERVLLEMGGNVSRSAQRLKMSRETLYQKFKKYNIDPKQTKALAKPETPATVEVETAAPPEEKPETPFYLDLKQLITYIKRRFKNKDEAEINFTFPHNFHYKEFKFFVEAQTERKGHQQIKTRWFNWVLTPHGGKKISTETGTPELHEAAAQLCGRLKDEMYSEDEMAFYYDPKKKKYTTVSVTSMNRTYALNNLDSYAWIRDENGDIIEVLAGYLKKWD